MRHSAWLLMVMLVLAPTVHAQGGDPFEGGPSDLRVERGTSSQASVAWTWRMGCSNGVYVDQWLPNLRAGRPHGRDHLLAAVDGPMHLDLTGLEPATSYTFQVGPSEGCGLADVGQVSFQTWAFDAGAKGGVPESCFLGACVLVAAALRKGVRRGHAEGRLV